MKLENLSATDVESTLKTLCDDVSLMIFIRSHVIWTSADILPEGLGEEAAWVCRSAISQRAITHNSVARVRRHA
jgi:hypothetical protein